METLVGTMTGRKLYHRPGRNGNHFLIHEFRTDDGRDTVVKGPMNTVGYGWTYRLHGEWQDEGRGPTFAFGTYDPMVPRSSKGVAEYLSKHLPTVGVKWATRIAAHFGNDTLSILKECPDKLSEVPGLSLRMLSAIKLFLASEEFTEVDPTVYASLRDLLEPIRPPRSVINKLMKEFGSDAPNFVREHPYRLQDLPGIGWDRVDRLAIDHLQYDRRGLERHRQAVIEALTRKSEHGHTKVEAQELRFAVDELLKMVPDDRSIASLVDDGSIIPTESDGQTYYSLWKLHEAEKTIARRIAELQAAASPLRLEDEFDGLEDDQTPIVELIRTNGVCILAGVPGSGKSFATGKVIQGLLRIGIESILVVAPTGKASKRSAEFLGEFIPGSNIPCMTMHSALGLEISDEAEGISRESAKVNRGREPWKFAHDEENKLQYEFFVIDEASMEDSPLAAAFLLAIPDGSRVLIVGDPYQLPSVGPGAVLRDMIESGVPSVILDTPRRNSGVIAQACFFIKNGRVPRPTEGGNWTHREIASDDDICNFIIELHANYVRKYGTQRTKDDLQVISPTKKNLLGCHSLNASLAPIVNPILDYSESVTIGPEKESETFRAGDKIVRLKNGNEPILLDPEIPAADLAAIYGSEQAALLEAADWRSCDDMIRFNGQSYVEHVCRLVNGDVGEIVGFTGSGATADILVRFKTPERLCRLRASESHIALAYAMTVHKMQGSSAPWIVLPLADYYWNPKDRTGLWNRELVYTAFSRPTVRLITVGKLAHLQSAVSRVTIHQRQTLLRAFLSQYEVSV